MDSAEFDDLVNAVVEGGVDVFGHGVFAGVAVVVGAGVHEVHIVDEVVHCGLEVWGGEEAVGGEGFAGGGFDVIEGREAELTDVFGEGELGLDETFVFVGDRGDEYAHDGGFFGFGVYTGYEAAETVAVELVHGVDEGGHGELAFGIVFLCNNLCAIRHAEESLVLARVNVSRHLG